MKPERTGDFYAIVCALICGLGNIPAKVGLGEVTAELFNFYYFIFAFAISILALVNRGNREEMAATTKRSFLMIGALTVLFTLGIYTFMYSIKLIEPATVSFLSRVETIFTILLAYLILKERLHLFEIFGGMVAIIGVLFLKFETNLTVSRVATLMIASSLFFAIAEILVKKFVNEIGTIRFVLIRNIFAVIFFLIILKVQGQDISFPNRTTLIMAALTALLLPVLGRITYIKALQKINVSRAALITLSTPLFTALFALIFLGTSPGPMEWVGGLMIVTGVGIVRFSGLKQLFKPTRTIVKPPM